MTTTEEVAHLVDLVGVGSVHAATRLYEELAAVGVHPVVAAEWIGQFSAGTVVGWATHFESVDAAMRWKGSRFSSIRAANWAAVTADPVEAKSWIRVTGKDPSAAAAWISVGVEASSRAAEFLDSALQPSDVGGWALLGVTTPDEIVRWGERWSLEVAGRWTRRLRLSVNGAWEWFGHGESDLDEAALWVTAGVDVPDRAGELSEIGLNAETYSEIRAATNDAELRSALRVAAVGNAGLTLEDGIVTFPIEGSDPESIEDRLRRVCDAAARAGESELQVRHGWPHLSLSAIEAVPEARYVRGMEKVALLRFLSTDPPPELDLTSGSDMGWGVADDGAVTTIRLRPNSSPEEFLVLDRQVA